MSPDTAPRSHVDPSPEAEIEQLRQQLAATERRVQMGIDRHRMILDSAVEYAVIALDLDGLVLEWNEGARRILGWTEVEIRGCSASLFFTEEDRVAGVPEAEMSAALNEGHGTDERWHQRKDGTRFWANGEMMPLRDAAGTLQGFIKVLRDRTEQHQAAERHRADAEFLRGVLASSADCIKVLDLDAKLTFMSEGSMRVMEVGDFNAIRGCPWPDFWQGQGNVDAKAAVAAACAGGTGHFRGMADTIAGTPRWWDVQVTPIFGADGRPERLLAVSRDITAVHAAEAALGASEARWRGLFERLSEGIILGELMRDAAGRAIDWRYLDVNPAWGEQVGLPAAAAVGHTVRELFPGIEDAWVTEMAEVVGSGRPAQFIREVGNLGRWYEGRAFPLEADRFAVLFVEVTQRKAGEERRAALTKLGDRLRDMDDPAAIAFAVAEAIGRTLGADRTGYGAMTADGRTIEIERDWSAVPGQVSTVGRHDMRAFGTYFEDLVRGEPAVLHDTATDLRTSAAGLDAYGIKAAVNVPLLEHGRLVALLFANTMVPRRWAAEEVDFMRDVAELTRSVVQRRRAEHALRDLAASLERQVEERTRALQNSEKFTRLALTAVGGVGVWTYDVATDRFSCDAAIADLYALDPAEAAAGINRADFLAHVHPDDLPALRAVMTGGLKREGELEMEYRIRHPDGSIRWVLSRGHTYFDDTGHPVRRAGVGVEMTQQRQLEDQLRQSQKMEAVGQLTGGLAHDFNNLLTGVTGSLELMQTRIAQGRIKDVDRYVQAAQGAAKRAAALTHRLLAFSRRQTLDPKATDVNRLVGGMEDLIRRTAGPEIAVEMQVGTDDLWPTLVDPGQLENALLNLCINARDAMPDGGRLTIETANRFLDERGARLRDLPTGQYVSLCVSDTGTGMPPEVIAKAFDPFFTTKPIGMGTGLGLSMIYGFVKQSGGQVRIHSEVGHGTTVCLYLPRHLGSAEMAETAPELADAPRAEAGQTVLVVDDEPTVRMLVTDVLEDLGYTAIEAADGAAGLKVLQSDVRLDLLVTDVGLPGGMNGRQVADAARVVRPDLRVLFITGYAENAVLSHGHLDPGMHVLVKPFAMETLANRIKELIDTQEV
ncbi:MAG: PAS domain-containing protein [Janthinobacterium lividum]